MQLLNELKRRNVFRVGIAYIVMAWLAMQVADVVLNNVEAPGWVFRVILLLLGIGFIFAMFFAWAFELTPEGIKRESEVDRSQSIAPQTGRKLDRYIILLLVVAVGLLLADRLGFEPTGSESLTVPGTGQAEQAAVESAPAPTGRKSVAVLPFLAISNGPDDEYFTDGLTEEILNSLAQLPELLVTARTSAFHFKGKDLPIQEIAGTLGVDHVVEGSVRREGSRMRITVQLIRASDGFHIWSETYDRTSEDSLEVQADIAEKIARALDVVLDDQRLAAMREAGVGNPEAYIAFQKGMELYALAHGSLDQVQTLERANRFFETAIELEPALSDAYMAHSDYFTHMLMDVALGVETPGITRQQLDTATEALKSDFEAAQAHARDVGRRLNAEFDLALLTGKWRGISALMDRAFEQPGCGVSLWVQNIAAAFGSPRKLLDDYRRLLECDPLALRPRVHMVRANIWLEDFDAAIAAALKGMNMANHEWVLEAYISALIAAGRLDEAQAAAERELSDESKLLAYSIYVAAARGDRAVAEALWDTYRSMDVPPEMTTISIPAVIGNREQANERAAGIDAKPLGHLVLLSQIYACACGAPFDLDATPNFAARLEESGLAWPPKSPTRYPLKTW